MPIVSNGRAETPVKTATGPATAFDVIIEGKRDEAEAEALISGAESHKERN